MQGVLTFVRTIVGLTGGNMAYRRGRRGRRRSFRGRRGRRMRSPRMRIGYRM